MATLRQMRQDAGLSMEELAHLSNTSLATIVRIERGNPPVTRLTAGRVLYALSQRVGRTIAIEDVEGLHLHTKMSGHGTLTGELTVHDEQSQ